MGNDRLKIDPKLTCCAGTFCSPNSIPWLHKVKFQNYKRAFYIANDCLQKNQKITCCMIKNKFKIF